MQARQQIQGRISLALNGGIKCFHRGRGQATEATPSAVPQSAVPLTVTLFDKTIFDSRPFLIAWKIIVIGQFKLRITDGASSCQSDLADADKRPKTGVAIDCLIGQPGW